MLACPPGLLGLFTSGEAFAAGWTRAMLRSAELRGDVVRVRRGAWAPALDPADPRSADVALARIAIAAARSARGAAVSHLAAATAEDLPTWAADPHPCATVVGRSRIDLDGVHTHRGGAMRAINRGGVVLTTPARTVVDIAREFGTESALVTANAALRAGLLTADELASGAAACRGPGTDRVRALLDLVDPLAESPLESRSRWHFDQHRIPQPQSQVEVFTDGGRFLGRCDFFWAEGVVGEVDGTLKYDTVGAHGREKWRQELFERTGLLFVRWGARDLVDFREVAALIRDRRARAAQPGWPRHWTVPPTPDR